MSARLTVWLSILAATTVAVCADPCTISIDVTKALGPVNRMVFGHNIEAADGAGIFEPVGGKPYSSVDGEGTWDDAERQPDPYAVKIAQQVGLSVIRYPGGCLAHNFDWKQTVGPLTDRPNWHFGVDEYLQVCKAMNAQPLITIPDYRDTPQDAADLVEYLNMPAVAKYPWAMKRAAWGHPDPYRVRWFELGNESNHGNHYLKPHRVFSADDYADYALATGRAMKAVDPSIQLGLQAGNGLLPGAPWNAIVYRKAGSIADFIVIHRYSVGIGNGNSGEDPATIAQACMAAGEQEEKVLQDHVAEIKKFFGRDMPIALDEYNVGAVQEKPEPYRFGYAEALYSADYVRILLNPSYHILMANYWQIFNGYWGMVYRQGNEGEFTPRPAFALYSLWGQHFGDTLVASTTDCPRIDFAGYSSVKEAQTPPPSSSKLPRILPVDFPTKQISPAISLRSDPDGADYVDVSNASGLSYPVFTNVPRPADAQPDAMTFRFSCEARFIPSPGSTYGEIGLGLCDSRGWDATHSAAALSGLGQAHDWTPFSTTFTTKRDCPGIDVLVRAETKDQVVSGTLQIRHLQLEQEPLATAPPYAALTSIASLSTDKKTLYVMVFNKSASDDLDTTLTFPGFHAASARTFTVAAKSLDAGAWSEASDRETQTTATAPVTSGGAVHVTFPAHSMTAVEVSR